MRIIKTFTDCKIRVGDFILFQEYDFQYSGKDTLVSKPIYAIYMGMDVYDMAAVMRYVRVPKEYHPYEKAENFKLEEHIEWYTFIDVLGHWNKKPNWHELLTAYRKFEPNSIVKDSEITAEGWKNYPKS